MALNLRISVSISAVPTALLDDDIISQWIENRLEDSKELFLRNINRGGVGMRASSSRGAGMRFRRRRGRLVRVRDGSKPGEYPISDTGNLGASLTVVMTSKRDGVLTSSVPYAKYLTRGTRYMAARRMLNDAKREIIDSRRANGDELAGAARFDV